MDQADSNTGRSNGFAFVPIAVAIAAVAIMSLLILSAVRNSTERAAHAACSGERSMLLEVAQDYMIDYQLAELPAIGDSANRYELALVDAGALSNVSIAWDLASDGTVLPTATPCPT